ncbi:MAG: lamin tail domain-containing protein, partial [Acidobacteriota bacterium]
MNSHYGTPSSKKRTLSVLLACLFGLVTWAGPASAQTETGNGSGPLPLLISEIVVTPTSGEYVEIHNPNSQTVDLDDYYLTDATFPPGSQFYYNLPDIGAAAGGGGFGDWHARFPIGASIAPGETQVLAISEDFSTTYTTDPDYFLYITLPDSLQGGSERGGATAMREAFAGSINDQGSLTNSGEIVILYYWDGSSDLVVDVDYAVWGDAAEAVDKTGVSIDGPDADSDATSFAPDVAIASQEVISSVAHPVGGSFERLDPTEGRETQNGSNGLGGASETSEDVDTTWLVATLATPGSFESAPLVVNEIHADPDFAGGDANGDGTVDGSEDEFVEIVNVTDALFDLSGFVIRDSFFDRHVFPTPTVLAPGCSVVVFGGGTLTGPFGNAQAQISSTALLSLNNVGDGVFVSNNGLALDAHVYGSEGSNNQSLTRDPDLTGGFTEHTTATGSGGALFSPGTRIDGSNFAIDCAVGPGAPVEIFEIQGDGDASPLAGQMVLTESNIVTAVTVDGFFIQTPDARSDNDDQTSDGLFVFTNSAPTVAVGDEVDVLGMIEEFFALTRFADGGLALTINSSANGLPTAGDLDAST